MSAAFDIESINPGVREIVGRLRAVGFRTTDSGDGQTNVAAGIEGALDFPHVHMVVDPYSILSEALRLLSLIRTWGIEAEIQATYNPADGVATLSLLGQSGKGF